MHPFPEGAQVAAYFRDSGGRNQELSVAQQEKSVGEWAKANGLILTRVFSDLAQTGTNADRAEFQAMVSHFQNGAKEAGLVVWEYARISRDLDDFQYYVADLRRAGYIVHSISDNVPPGLDGRLLEAVTSYRNAKFVEDLKRNVQRGLRYGATVHHAYYGPTPTGYQVQAVTIGKRRDGADHIIHQLIPDPDTAPLVRKAFDLRGQGSTLAEIDTQTRLHSWPHSYAAMLANQIYLGRREYGGIIVDGFCEPLVTRETWDAAQATNKRNDYTKGGIHPRMVRSRFFLSGLGCFGFGCPLPCQLFAPDQRSRLVVSRVGGSW